jgi:ribonuclease Z
VVISGDTAQTPELVAAAKDADVLVSEALSLRMVEALRRAAEAAGASRQAKIFGDIETYHTDPKDVAAEANVAGVKLLVYSHLAPGLPQPVLEKLFFDGVVAVRERKGWLVGFDGLRLDLPFAGGEPVQGKMPMLGRN